MIKNIGFEENKKCRVCNLMAFYQIQDTTFCEKHMQGFIEFKKEIEK